MSFEGPGGPAQVMRSPLSQQCRPVRGQQCKDETGASPSQKRANGRPLVACDSAGGLHEAFAEREWQSV